MNLLRVGRNILHCVRAILRLCKRINSEQNKPTKPTTTSNSSGAMKMHATLTTLPGKKGVGLGLTGPNGSVNLVKMKQLNTSWSYGWSLDRSENQASGVDFIPQVWGGAKDQDTMWQRLEQKVVPQIEAGHCKMVLAFNEPDKKNQSNLTVEQCLELWPQLEKLGVPLCSPSCANPLGCRQAQDSCQGVSGSWMLDFMSGLEERGYRCDYLGVHWYGGPSFPAFQKRMREIYDSQGGKYPLMLTEFAVADWNAMNKSCENNRFTQKQVLEFMKKALPWMEQQDWIAAYAWFPYDATCSQGTCSSLFDQDGQLTGLGRYYASVTPENPEGNQDIGL